MSPSGAELFVVFLPGWALCGEHRCWSWTPFSGLYPCRVPLSLTQPLASLGHVCLSALSYTWPLDSSWLLVLPKPFCAFPRSCCYSVIKSCQILCNPMDCSTPGFPVLHHLLEFAQTHVHWVGDTIQLSHPLSCPSPRALHLSQYRGLFQSVSSSNQVAKILKLQLQNQSFQWISGLISFRVDWFGLLAFKGTLKSLLQHHNSKASILQPSAFFMVQLSQPYMTTGKTIASTKLTFVGKVMSLIFSKLSRFVIAFLQKWFYCTLMSSWSSRRCICQRGPTLLLKTWQLFQPPHAKIWETSMRLLFTRDPISLERHRPLLSDTQLLGLFSLCFLPSELSQGSEETLQSELLLPLLTLLHSSPARRSLPRLGDGCGGDWCTLLPKSLFQVNSWNLL